MFTQLAELLRQHRLSLTQPRRQVFNYLGAHGPVTIGRIIASLPAIDRASIYRTLNTFRQYGIIHDIITGGQKMVELTDRFNPHHHHLVCTGCGKSVDITDAPIEQRLTALAGRHGFSAQSHQIEVSGLCADCSKVS